MADNSPSIEFRPAHQEDSELLTKTATESKKMWGYTPEQMDLWKNELTITAKYIAKNKVFKIFADQNYIGFISLSPKNEFVEIDHFWLLPENTQKGYGRKIIDFIVKITEKMDYTTLRVYAEPYANGFYEKMGGKIIERKESKIKNRFLSVFEFTIDSKNPTDKLLP